jgi:hypothetical protein
MEHLLAALLLLLGPAVAQTRLMTGADVLYSLMHPSPTVLPSTVLPSGGVGPAGTPSVSISGATLDSAGRLALQRSDGTSLAPLVLPIVGTPTTIPTSATIGLSAAMAAAGVSVPNMLFMVDAAAPASQFPASATRASLQVDASNNIVAYGDPISGFVWQHGFGQAQYSAGGIGGYPVIRNNSGTNINTGYDALVAPDAARAPNGLADKMIAADYAPYYCNAVLRQTEGGGQELFRLYSTGGTHSSIGSTGDADGRLVVGQNNGSTVVSEAAPAASYIGQPIILEWGTDGSRFYIWRKGVNTATSNTGIIGGYLVGGVANLELFNNSKSDTSALFCAAGMPSLSSRASMLAFEANRYAISGVTAPSVGPADTVPAKAPDLTATFLSSPNFPLTTPLPTRAGATLGNGLTLNTGAMQAFSLLMGTATPGANMTTGQSIRDTFFMNYFTGNQSATFGSPMDTGQGDNNTFAGVARHYAPGDVNDVHQMRADGMYLRAMCSKNHSDCSPGKVWAGMTRLAYPMHPGMTIKFVIKPPAGNFCWTPIWFFSGEQNSPGPGGNPYDGFGTPATKIRGGGGNTTVEIDWNDMFSVVERGTASGKQIVMGEPDIYGTAWPGGVAPHNVFRASKQGYVPHLSGGAPYLERPTNWSTAMHTMVINWRGDGSNLLDLIEDGKTVQTDYMAFPQQTYTDASGATKTLGMHLIISNQGPPAFATGHSAAIDNDGIPDGWSIGVQEITAWIGNVSNPDALRVQ